MTQGTYFNSALPENLFLLVILAASVTKMQHIHKAEM